MCKVRLGENNALKVGQYYPQKERKKTTTTKQNRNKNLDNIQLGIFKPVTGPISQCQMFPFWQSTWKPRTLKLAKIVCFWKITMFIDGLQVWNYTNKFKTVNNTLQTKC